MRQQGPEAPPPPEFAASYAAELTRTCRALTLAVGDAGLAEEAAEGDVGVVDQVVGGGVTLEATTAPRATPEIGASYWADGTVLVDVAGQRAVFAPWGAPATDTGGWLRWQADGVTYSLSGALPVTDLVELATTVGPVDVTDPRLDGLPAYPAG